MECNPNEYLAAVLKESLLIKFDNLLSEMKRFGIKSFKPEIVSSVGFAIGRLRYGLPISYFNNQSKTLDVLYKEVWEIKSGDRKVVNEINF